MKPHLILTALGLGMACHAHGEGPAVQQVADARAAAVKTIPPPTSSSVRYQLSEQERAVLRRQLYEFSRPRGKRQ